MRNSSRIYKGMLATCHKSLKNDADRIRLSISSKGGTQALGSLLDHMAAYYVDETLESFCTFLDDHSKCKKRPRIRQIAVKIRSEMRK